MFKDRAVQIKMVRTDKSETGSENVDIPTVDPKQIAEIATEFTIKTVGAIGAVIAVNKVLSTICEITVVTVRAKLK